MMTRRSAWLVAVLSVGALAPAHLCAQNAIGLSGLVVNPDTTNNAFGLGLSYTLDPTIKWPALEFGLPFGWTGRFKVLMTADLEVLTGGFKRPNTCRDPSPITGGPHFYHDCDTGEQFAPDSVEGPAGLRGVGAVYPVVDLGPLRLGLTPLSGRFGEGRRWSALVGLATSRRSWVVLELPWRDALSDPDGFRFRIEAAIWANPLATF